MTAIDRRLIGDGSQCRVFASDISYHVWSEPPKRGALCKCGTIQIKSMRRNGQIARTEAAIDADLRRMGQDAEYQAEAKRIDAEFGHDC